MATVLLSEGEKMFILEGVQDDIRTDGRHRNEYRHMELEIDVLTNASGSARFRVANTDVLVGIKTEITIPTVEKPDEGKLEFFVNCSSTATPAFEGRGGEVMANQISGLLANAYKSSKAFDLKSLCILPKHKSWKLFIDIMVLQCGGNLFDAVSMAVKAALYCTRVPKVTCALMDGGATDLVLSDDPYEFKRIPVDSLPLLVTICKIGDYCLVDPTEEEETCSTAGIVVGVSCKPNKSSITTIKTLGRSSLHWDTLNNCIKLSISTSECLNQKLMDLLRVKEKKNPIGLHGKNIYGFLK